MFVAPQHKTEQSMSNLRLSTQIINLSPQSQTGELVITNIHPSASLLFKIKTKIEKVMEVRPSRGLLKCGQKAIVAFKPFNKLSEPQRNTYQKTLQFLLQGVSITKQQLTKEEEQALWKAIKEKKADISLGYSTAKIGINFSGMAEQKQFIAPLSTYQSKIDNKFSSNVKSEKSAVSAHELHHFASEIKNMPKNDNQLSEKYAQLKTEHEELERERAKLFTVKGSGDGKSSNAKTIKLLIIFIVFFLVGNYLRGVFEPAPVQVVQPEKGWYEKLFG